MSSYDVAIIGGGPAGLSAALTLARARRRAVVLDTGTPRNVSSPGVHGFLSRDGISPVNLKRAARADIEAYGGVDFLNLAARKISWLDRRCNFRIDTGASIGISATFVILAPGMIDRLPDIDGLPAHWGRNVIHCEFCHGWENADRRWGVIVQRVTDLDSIDRILNWTSDITVFVSPDTELAKKAIGKLAHTGVVVVHGNVRALLAASDGQLVAVKLADGRTIACDTLLLKPDQEQTRIVRDTGLEMHNESRLIVNEHHETSVTGIYAGGDIIPGPQTALTAAETGAVIGRRIAFLLATGRSSRPQKSLQAVTA